MQEGDFQITLGGETIDVPAITIGQTIAIAAATSDSAEILRIALEPVFPDITKAHILAKRGGIKSLNAAVKKVLQSGEFLSGEDKPAAAPATEQNV